LHRKLLLSSTVLFVLVSLAVSVEADSLKWYQWYGGSSNELAFSVVVTSDGGYALAGYTMSFGVGGYDFWLVKTDAYGDMTWNQTYGRPKNDIPQSLVVTSDGGYALAGRTTFFDSLGPFDFWLVKTDAFGNMEWNQTYGEEFDDDWAHSVVVTADGGYAIAGYTNSSGADNYDFWLIKTDTDGNVEWNRTYGGPEADRAYSLALTSDGGYAMTGSTWSFGAGSSDFWLVKTDELGNVEWNQTYGGTGTDEANSVFATSDGGYAIAGHTNSFGAGQRDFWLVKTDSSGIMEWNKTYAGTGDDNRAYSVIETSGGYALAGSMVKMGFPPSPKGACLIKTDELGNMEWNRTYEGHLSNAYSLVETSDGGYAIAGEIARYFSLLKTDEYGIIPEYSSWLLPSLLLVATSVIIIYKKR
jgi:hypothetical protein